MTEENENLKLIASNHEAAMNLLNEEKNSIIKKLEDCLNEKAFQCESFSKHIQSLNIQNENLTESLNKVCKNLKLNIIML
jgi:hypothetical protein